MITDKFVNFFCSLLLQNCWHLRTFFLLGLWTMALWRTTFNKQWRPPQNAIQMAARSVICTFIWNFESNLPPRDSFKKPNNALISLATGEILTQKMHYPLHVTRISPWAFRGFEPLGKPMISAWSLFLGSPKAGQLCDINIVGSVDN